MQDPYMIAPPTDVEILQPGDRRLRLMSVMLAHIAAALTASSALTMPDSSIDAETTRLAAQAQAGNEAAFCALIELHERAARRVAAAALGNTAEVDEAVQDACIAAWQRLPRLDDPSAFRAWLLKITWRKALDRRRSVQSWLKRLSGHRESASSEPDPVEGLAARERSVVDRLIHDEREEIVARMIRSLPSRLRDPFLLAASGEHRYEDIAAMLSIPIGTLKWRVSEARRILRVKLAHLEMER
jgi:RNA polymerase sigma-70 factor (ECF subfamily)